MQRPVPRVTASEKMQEQADKMFGKALKANSEQRAKNAIAQVNREWEAYRTRCCGDCYYFMPYPADRCRRYPPVPASLGDRVETSRSQIEAATRACGEWKPVPQKPENVRKSKPEGDG